jgi:hypothetical protein
MRKQSDKTKARMLTSRLNARLAYEKSLIAELQERRRVGGMLSNIAFNLSQGEKVAPEIREVMSECRKAWDEIKRTAL